MHSVNVQKAAAPRYIRDQERLGLPAFLLGDACFWHVARGVTCAAGAVTGLELARYSYAYAEGEGSLA